ncbi:MAG: PTS sugar transporter subunit IIA [Planctomycetes bacterium]|nr:PTS sugar transporter subunit IIA [Planctomycetota bacterium]
MRLADILQPERVAFLGSRDKASALDDLCRLFASSPKVRDARAFREAILRREETLSTGIGLGLAVPHAKIDSVTDFVLAVGVHHGGIDFDSLDKKPVHILTMVGTPSNRQREYLQLLAQITHLLKEEPIRQDILQAPTPQDVYRIFAQEP